MRFALFVVLVFLFSDAYSQDENVDVNLLIINDLTGKELDATLTWYDPALVKKNGIGIFTLSMGQGREEVVKVSKTGFFDQEITIDYEAVKRSPNQEVRLQPKVPQLKLSLTPPDKKAVAATVALHTVNDNSEFFNELISAFPFTIDLDYNQSLILDITSAGYFPVSDSLDLTGVFDGRVVERKFQLTALKAGNKHSPSSIQFHDNQLTDLSQRLLKSVVDLMRENHGMVLGIGVNAAVNPAISQERVKAMIDFFASSGIDRSRLQIRPVSKSNNSLVEFTIIKL